MSPHIDSVSRCQCLNFQKRACCTLYWTSTRTRVNRIQYITTHNCTTGSVLNYMDQKHKAASAVKIEWLPLSSFPAASPCQCHLNGAFTAAAKERVVETGRKLSAAMSIACAQQAVSVGGLEESAPSRKRGRRGWKTEEQEEVTVAACSACWWWCCRCGILWRWWG